MFARSTLRRGLWTVVATCAWASVAPSAGALEFPGPVPGKAAARLEAGRLVLENAAIKAVWDAGDGPFRLVEVVDKLAGNKMRAGFISGETIHVNGGRFVLP